MEIAKIKNSTRTLAPPRDWDQTLDGECISLAIRDDLNAGSSCVLSAWKPTQAELEILNGGGAIVLGIIGTNMPPAFLYAALNETE